MQDSNKSQNDIVGRVENKQADLDITLWLNDCIHFLSFSFTNIQYVGER